MTNDEVQKNVQYPMTNYTSKPPGDSEVLEEAFWAGFLRYLEKNWKN